MWKGPQDARLLPSLALQVLLVTGVAPQVLLLLLLVVVVVVVVVLVVRVRSRRLRRRLRDGPAPGRRGVALFWWTTRR